MIYQMFWLAAVFICRIDSWASVNDLCLNRSKSKCIMLSRTNISFVIPGLSIKGNEIDFNESATNLDIIFNDRLSWSIVGRIYSMLRNLWPVIDSTSLRIRIQPLVISFLPKNVHFI